MKLNFQTFNSIIEVVVLSQFQHIISVDIFET